MNELVRRKGKAVNINQNTKYKSIYTDGTNYMLFEMYVYNPFYQYHIKP